MPIAIARVHTPLGAYALAASEVGITHVAPEQDPALPDASTDPGAEARAHAEAGARALLAYFAGDPGAVEGLTLAAVGTPFQQRVWSSLREIPFGQTESYGALARRVGRPGAARAVGQANHRNPLGIVVPCHRIIGADGSLTGYAGGVDRKRWLLRHEAATGGSPDAA